MEKYGNAWKIMEKHTRIWKNGKQWKIGKTWKSYKAKQARYHNVTEWKIMESNMVENGKETHVTMKKITM